MTVLPALYSGVPTVTVDGDASAVLESAVTSMVVEDAADGLATCEIGFENQGFAGGGIGFPLLDPSLVDFGSSLLLQAGGGEAFGDLFAGTVTAVEVGFPQGGTARLTLLADDALQPLRRQRRTRVFEDMSDADILDRVAREHGLSADVSGGDTRHRVVAQLDQSDLAFVRDRARRMGAEVAAAGTRLIVQPRPDRRGEPVTLSYRQNLREAQLSADLGRLVTEVAVSGWDPGTKQAIDVSAGPSTMASERETGGTAGWELLERVRGGLVDRVAHAVPLAVDEAQALADARFRQQARRFVTGRLVVDGDARVRVGGVVELAGIGPWHTGTYDVTGVRHLFDLDEGFRTVVDVERAELTR